MQIKILKFQIYILNVCYNHKCNTSHKCNTYYICGSDSTPSLPQM